MRETIDSAIQSDADKNEGSLATKIQESITKTQEERKKYLDALESQASNTTSTSTSGSTTSSTSSNTTN